MNTTCTCVEVSSIETSSQIHLRVTRSMTANTAMLRAAGEMRAVVDPDRVAAVVRPLRERTTLRADPSRALQNQPVCSQNAADGRRRDPHRSRVAAAVRELAMRTVDLAPALEQLEDRGHLLGAQAVHRAARLAVAEAVGIAPAAPPPRPPLVQLEIDAGAAVLPAVGDGPIDQIQQLVLGGRVDATRDPATQPQRSFPSASINLTPISFNASDSRAISALAAASSGSGPPWRTPGRDDANASSAPCLATVRSFTIVERSTPARSAASTVVNSPRNNPIQISYFCEGDRNRFARRPPLLPAKRPGSVIEDPFLVVPEASQMWANQNPDLCH